MAAASAQQELAKTKIEEIRKAAIEHGWELLSTEYKNLDTELSFKCDEGHTVYAPYKKLEINGNVQYVKPTNIIILKTKLFQSQKSNDQLV